MPPIRLSRRVQQVAASATLAMTEKARALRASGVDVIALAAGEPDFDTPAMIKQAACDALAAGDTKYPSPVSGIAPLRDAVCAYMRTYCALGYTPDQVCVTVGAKDAIYLALQALVDPGDEVLIPAPYWVSYPDQVRLAGGEPVFVRPTHGLKIDADAIDAAIGPRTRVLILNNPCNPTGMVYTLDELAAIAEVVSGSDVLVISDEIYHRLVFDGERHTAFATLPGMLERTITVDGFSKTFAMTGWRLGYACGPAPAIKAMARLQGQSTSGAASFIQTAAVTALTGDQHFVAEMASAYRRRCGIMTDGLSAIPGISCERPRGAFYCFPDVSGTFERLGVSDADGFAEQVLERAHVACVSGVAFGMPTHARLSFATGDERITEALRRLRDALG